MSESSIMAIFGFLWIAILGNLIYRKKLNYGPPVTEWPKLAQKLLSFTIKGAVTILLFILLGCAYLCYAKACTWVAPTNYNLPAFVYKAGYNTDDVILLPRPRDCEWNTSPLGDKLCHYEKDIALVGERQKSVVRVTWRKVNEAIPPR